MFDALGPMAVQEFIFQAMILVITILGPKLAPAGGSEETF